MAEQKDVEVYKPIDLQSRLKDEQETLEKYFWPEKFPIFYINNEHYFERIVKLAKERIYKLRVYVKRRYPDSLPDLVVCESPEPMPNGPNWSGSHATHTWPRKDGFLHICHWRWVCWTRKNMIHQVFNKGEEWLEAYEKYRVNRKLPLDLQEMQLTEEEKIKEQKRNAKHAVWALCQNPIFFNQSHQWHLAAIKWEILSQRAIIGNDIPQIRNTEQRTSVSAIQRANHDPTGNWLAGMLKSQCAISESQHLPISDDEIRNAQQKMLESATQKANDDPSLFLFAELCRLQCEITECKLANPRSTNDVSFTQTDRQLCINVTSTLPQNLQNSDKYSDFMIKHY